MDQNQYQAPKRSSAAPILIIVGVIFLAGIAVVAGLGVMFFKAATTGVSGVRSVSDTFVKDYAAGNGKGAFGLMCTSAQSGTSPARVASAAKFLIIQNGPVTGTSTMAGWRMNNFNGISYATIGYAIPYKNKPSTMSVTLIKNQTWQVQTYNVNMQ